MSRTPTFVVGPAIAGEEPPPIHDVHAQPGIGSGIDLEPARGGVDGPRIDLHRVDGDLGIGEPHDRMLPPAPMPRPPRWTTRTRL